MEGGLQLCGWGWDGGCTEGEGGSGEHGTSYAAEAAWAAGKQRQPRLMTHACSQRLPAS